MAGVGKRCCSMPGHSPSQGNGQVLSAFCSHTAQRPQAAWEEYRPHSVPSHFTSWRDGQEQSVFPSQATWRLQVVYEKTKGYALHQSISPHGELARSGVPSLLMPLRGSSPGRKKAMLCAWLFPLMEKWLAVEHTPSCISFPTAGSLLQLLV